jgi:hypothetical protein
VRGYESLFQQGLERDLDNPEFRAAFVRESVKIATIDRVINALDDARLAQGLGKAELARGGSMVRSAPANATVKHKEAPKTPHPAKRRAIVPA